MLIVNMYSFKFANPRVSRAHLPLPLGEVSAMPTERVPHPTQRIHPPTSACHCEGACARGNLRARQGVTPSPGGEGGPQGRMRNAGNNLTILGNLSDLLWSKSATFSKPPNFLPHSSSVSLTLDSFISAPRAAFGGCAPKRACGRSPRGKRSYCACTQTGATVNYPLSISSCHGGSDR